MAHATGAAVNQHPLTAFQAAMVDHALPGGQRRQRHGGGFDMGNVLGLCRPLSTLEHHMLRIASFGA